MPARGAGLVLGLSAAAGAVFFAGYSCGRYYAAKAEAGGEADADAGAKVDAEATAEVRSNGAARMDSGRPPTPGRHRQAVASPCTSDADSECGDIGSPRQESHRMVLVVRMDLKMSKQKTGAQLCHAALGLFKKLYKAKHPNLWDWEHNGRSTVVLRIADEEGLMSLKESAKAAKIPTHTVIDRASGAVGGAVKTVIAVGPATTEAVSQITRQLTLW